MSRARGVKFTPKFFILALLVAYVFVTAAERQARARGMIKPDETRYVLSTGGDYAQGGN